MNLTEYAQKALLTEANDFFAIRGRCEPQNLRLAHAALGIVSEAGELAECAASIHYGKPMDRTNALEELGDILWYVPVAADALGLELPWLEERAQEFAAGLKPESTAAPILRAGRVLTIAAGTLADCVKKMLFYGREIDAGPAGGSLVFILGAVIYAGRALGASLETIAEANARKLARRYGHQFTEAAAIDRDLSAERAGLEADTAAAPKEAAQ